MKRSNKIIVIAIIGVMLALATAVILFINRKEDTNIVYDKKINLMINPMTIDSTPVFSWKLESDKDNQLQKSYHIYLAESEKALKQNKYIWDSGEIYSDISTGVEYSGPKLSPKTRYYWDVVCKNQDSKEYKSKEISYFETGITDGNWKNAKWIYTEELEPDFTNSMLVTEYTISFDIKINDAKAGLIWGCDSSDYGDGYLCAFNYEGEGGKMYLSKICKDQILDEVSVELNDFSKEMHNIKIDVSGDCTTYYVDGSEAFKEDNQEKRPLYLLGTWVNRGAFTANVDNILVQDNNEDILLFEDFEEENNIFSPYFITTKAGELIATSGIQMMPGMDKPAPVFTKEFETSNKEISSARLYASALGIYDIKINGSDISKDYFEPGTSVYDNRIFYKSYDITDYLKDKNDVFVSLGHGRYDRVQNTWGNSLGFLCLIDIEFKDGTNMTVVSDESWKAYNDTKIRRDDFYWGEYIDNTKELSNPQNVKILELADDVKIQAFEAEPVTCIKEITPVSVTEPASGVFVYDFGENFSGYCSFSIKGEKGQVITVRSAEAVNTDFLANQDGDAGTVWTKNLYTAKNTDYFVLAGGEEKEEFNPKFIYRGFRYVEISGIKEAIPLEDIKGIYLSTNLERTGYFESSDILLDSIYNAVYRTQQNNYTDVPTDCPQRDERLGWTGDFQVFSKTASYNSMTYNYFMYALEALYDTQTDSGSLASEVFTDNASFGAVGWGDAGITVPWMLYQQYGKLEPLKKYFDGMCRYVDYQLTQSQDYLNYGGKYGDHISINAIDTVYTNTVQCANSAYIVWKTAVLLEKNEEAIKYKSIYESYRDAWRENYLNEDGSIGSWSQTEYVLPLAYGLYPDDLYMSGMEKLNISVQASDFHPNTGYVATPYLLPLLSENGYIDSAYKLIRQGTYPSWGYMINLGMTTITEGWNVLYGTEDGKIGINGSLDHYSLGSVATWYYEYILGIKPDSENPGFKSFYLEPMPGGELSFAKGRYKTLYGDIVSSWEKTEGGYKYHFSIPENTSAFITLPDSDISKYQCGSGEYDFEVKDN